jgi:hypothetical protein
MQGNSLKTWGTANMVCGAFALKTTHNQEGEDASWYPPLLGSCLLYDYRGFPGRDTDFPLAILTKDANRRQNLSGVVILMGAGEFLLGLFPTDEDAVVIVGDVGSDELLTIFYSGDSADSVLVIKDRGLASGNHFNLLGLADLLPTAYRQGIPCATSSSADSFGGRRKNCS